MEFCSIRRRVISKLEDKKIVSPYNRLIFVTGMARSGTSAITAFLTSHPRIKAIVGGSCSRVVESDLIRPELGLPDWKSIDEALEECTPDFVVIKQPWLMPDETFQRAIRPAKMIVCLREESSIIGAWFRTEMVRRQDCKDQPKEVYRHHMSNVNRMMDEGALCVWQNKINLYTGLRLAKFVGVDPDGFDFEILGRKWKEKGQEEWIRENTITKNRRRL